MTTDTETLLALALRVEQASADEQRVIMQEVYETLVDAALLSYDASVRFLKLSDAKAFTEAAMSLVPEGCAVDFRRFTNGTARAVVWRTVVHPEPAFEHHCERAATPALALTAACLRALAGRVE